MNHTVHSSTVTAAPAAGYAGDLTPQQAWNVLAQNAGAKLVDVRTEQEWNAVGVPDLQELDQEVVTLSWILLPERQQNPAFAEGIQALDVSSETPLLFLCKGGGRSAAAAMAMTQAGYSHCYNVVDGFEGPAGWKSTQLPAKQVQ